MAGTFTRRKQPRHQDARVRRQAARQSRWQTLFSRMPLLSSIQSAPIVDGLVRLFRERIFNTRSRS
jgi:hypothetical protein